MTIKIHSVKFDADVKLEDFIQNKIGKLISKYDNVISAEVFLRLENAQNSENKIAEIKLEVPGSDIFAKKASKTFEESTDTAIQALGRQLSKYKDKIRGN